MIEEVTDFKISALEKKGENLEKRIKTNEGDIINIRLEMKDLKLIRQIVFGLVCLALMSVWDKLNI